MPRTLPAILLVAALAGAVALAADALKTSREVAPTQTELAAIEALEAKFAACQKLSSDLVADAAARVGVTKDESIRWDRSKRVWVVEAVAPVASATPTEHKP